jgi:hypothetical protein
MTLLSKESVRSLFHITIATVHHGEFGLYYRMALRFDDLVSTWAEPLRHRVRPGAVLGDRPTGRSEPAQ